MSLVRVLVPFYVFSMHMNYLVLRAQLISESRNPGGSLVARVLGILEWVLGSSPGAVLPFFLSI